MSTLLHPEGPESERTYWIRRGIVVGAVLLALVLVSWGVSMMVGSRATPATSAAPATTQAGTGSSTPAGAPTATLSSSQTSASTTQATTPAPSSTPASPASSATAPTTGSSTTSSTPTASPSSASAPNPNAPCDPARLTLTVQGPQRVASGTAMRITTTLATDQGCRLDLAATPLEIRIYSGNDRIWSTKDCDKDVPRANQQLHPEQGLVLTQTWPGQRSSGQCKLSGERLGAGTYVVTADLRGARPRQHVFQVT